MAYQLGVDLGTTYTAAAVFRDGLVEIARLGAQTASVPSVIFVRDDDTIVVGEAAARRGLTEPTRVVREFKRRFGDPTPIIVAGSPYAPDALMANLLSWVVETVAAQEGGRPERIALTFPANWGPYKQDLLAQALRIADVGEVQTLTEPEAAAISYAATERVEAGTVVAVYDLGGGTFDAALLRKTEGGFDLLGSPEGIEHLGGVDFDEAVFAHVQQSCAEAFSGIDAADPGIRAAISSVRRECVEAKEALSSDTEAAIAVLLNVNTQVRLTRAEFEDMIRPTLSPTVDALSRAISSANLDAAGVDVVLLAGGSSRIPLVGQLIAEQLARPVAVDIHPKHAVAMGAARRAADTAAVGYDTPGPDTAQAPPATQNASVTQSFPPAGHSFPAAAYASSPGPTVPAPARQSEDRAVQVAAPVGWAPPPQQPQDQAPSRPPSGRVGSDETRSWIPWLVAGLAIAVVGVVALLIANRGGNSGAIALLANNEAGADPFTGNASAPPPSNVTPPSITGSRASGTVLSVSGDQSGLYGATRNTSSCDVSHLAGDLGASAPKANAFASAAGIAPSDISKYLSGLTPVFLQADTRVTSHGFRNGRVAQSQAALQGGSSVLVDNRGIPRVRCAAGNPLTPPVPVQSSPTYEGSRWAAFDPRALLVVDASGTPINTFSVVDVNTGQRFNRAAGSQGNKDTDA